MTALKMTVILSICALIIHKFTSFGRLKADLKAYIFESTSLMSTIREKAYSSRDLQKQLNKLSRTGLRLLASIFTFVIPFLIAFVLIGVFAEDTSPISRMVLASIPYLVLKVGLGR